MIYWAGILVAITFAAYMAKKGLYEAWVLGFNILIAVYLAVFLGPTIANIPAVASQPCCSALGMTGTAIATFLVLQVLAWLFITGQFGISFPKLLDQSGAAVIAFFAGLLVWSFISYLLFLTPVTQKNKFASMGLNASYNQKNISYISASCNLIGKFAAAKDSGLADKESIAEYLKDIEKKAHPKKVERIRKPSPTDPNTIKADPHDPNTTVPATDPNAEDK